jgi:GH15 family glucan-1,4-alpha-glucosidase
MTLRIGDYALLSDCNTGALVGRDGSVDWLCLPRYDSPAVFARILDPDAGHWSIRPRAGYETRRRYLDGSLVLETTLETANGTAALIDALAFERGQRGHALGLDAPHELLRLVKGLSGRVELELELAWRPEYGLGRPLLSLVEGGAVGRGGPDRFGLASRIALSAWDGVVRGRFAVEAGEWLGFALRWAPVEAPDPQPTRAADVATAIEDTVEGWRSWEAHHDIFEGPHRELVRFSSRVLKGLTYRPTGAIVAAPTTSLPERIGGERNWDYRYSWIRDASLTIDALWISTCSDEVDEFVAWLLGAAGGHVHEDRPLQIMYGVGGERDLAERELPHLRGHRGSRPVRVGNGAWNQVQLDIYGEFIDAYSRYSGRLREPDAELAHFLADLADAAAARWQGRGSGIWEARSGRQHYLSGKLYSWVALDRALRLAPAIGARDRVDEWSRERDRIREAILTRGWSKRKHAFTQAFDSDELDAAALLVPLVGFLPPNDERVLSTLDAIERELVDQGLVLRYRSGDGLPGREGTFVICSFWLVSGLARAGRRDRAEALFEDICRFANDVGLLAEEIDPPTGELLGNFPQAFSHVGLITAARDLEPGNLRRE